MKALLTDLYQLTMARAYFERGNAERRACFQLVFRSPPFGGAYAIAAGIDEAIELAASLRFEDDELAYLASLRGRSGKPLVGARLLDALGRFRFSCDVHAVQEGTVVFPHEPLLRVEGPLWQAQIVETALLATIGFPTLVATKASRVKRAARGRDVLEFGARRAQGWHAALDASRAAFIGGCDATSNLLAGFDARGAYPVRGTHAHSFVLAIGDERAAFEAYAATFPDDAVFLVDTYDTEQGVVHAIEVARAMRTRGKELAGIRLDSGDLGALAMQARRALDDAGFPDVKIVASSDLDEHSVDALVRAGAPIDVFGVGTKLSTAFDQPALGCVYKLVAIDDGDGVLVPRVKRSNTPGKQTMPGPQRILRVAAQGRAVLDVVAHVDEATPLDELSDLEGRALDVPPEHEHLELCSPALRAGERCRERSTLTDARGRALAQLEALPEDVTRLDHPARYPVAFSRRVRQDRDRVVSTPRSGS